MASFLVTKDIFLGKFMSSNIAEGLNRMDLFCLFQVNCLQLLPLKFQSARKEM